MESTPNPRSMKFIPDGKDVLGAGTKTHVFRDVYEAGKSPLAVMLLKLDGVREVMLASDSITVTKSTLADWDELQDSVETTVSQFYASGGLAMRPEDVETLG